MKQINHMGENFNKGIFTTIGILIIVLVITIFSGGILVWQYLKVPKSSPTISTPTPTLVLTPTPTPIPIPTPTPTSAPMSTEIKVISLAYFPIKNGVLDTAVVNNNWGEYSMSLIEVRDKVQRLNQGLELTLEAGLRYHGYSNPEAQPSLDYAIVDRKEFLEPIPISTKPSPYDPMLFLTDYKKIIKDNNICDKVDNEGVREIWLWGYTGIGKSGWESNFSSRWGDISNSDRDPNDLPLCGHSYTIYEYNYGREVSEATEDHIHQFEALFNYVDRELFWNEFVGYFPGRTDLLETKTRRCGWAHYAPNSERDYDWNNSQIVQTDCMDWKPNVGKITSLNCEQWRCNGKDFFIFWMQSIPNKDNNLIYNGKSLRNWWDFVSDFDRAIQEGRSLSF